MKTKNRLIYLLFFTGILIFIRALLQACLPNMKFMLFPIPEVGTTLGFCLV